jgi:TFIIF-interacting CTD phosphatase-like protein
MSNNKRINFLLDLDATIIHGEPTEEYNFEKNKKKAAKFRFETMENYYIIFERPYLQQFLTFLFKNFNVSIWTAASKDYALFIIENIIIAGHKDRKIDYIFFSYHCGISKKIKRNSSKELSILWKNYHLPNYNENNVVILDDYFEDIHKNQKQNCIIAKPFDFKDKDSNKDKFLKTLQEYLRTIVLKDPDNLKSHVQTINLKMKEKNFIDQKIELV